MKIAFVELPEVPGRNDIIGRDYFAAGNWQDFKSAEEGNTVEEVNVSSAGQSKEVVTKVAQQLKLQAIGLSDKPQAFINDRLLSVGNSLAVTAGARSGGHLDGGPSRQWTAAAPSSSSNVMQPSTGHTYWHRRQPTQ